MYTVKQQAKNNLPTIFPAKLEFAYTLSKFSWNSILYLATAYLMSTTQLSKLKAFITNKPIRVTFWLSRCLSLIKMISCLFQNVLDTYGENCQETPRAHFKLKNRCIIHVEIILGNMTPLANDFKILTTRNNCTLYKIKINEINVSTARICYINK